MNRAASHAVITPYSTEEPRLLERCIASVRRQTAGAEHFLVADGHAQDWIDRAGVRHVRLDRWHADYGNTPRGIGALLAVAEGYRCIAFLDADNWYDPDHLERCLGAARACDGPECDYVIARRRWVRPDESVIDAPDEPIERHVDTNCLVLLSGACSLAPLWATLPREVASIGDRIFLAALRARGWRAAAVAHPTVNYHCLWEHVYRAAGESPPPGAKPPIDTSAVAEWLRRASDRELEIAGRLAGVRFARPASR